MYIFEPQKRYINDSTDFFRNVGMLLKNVLADNGAIVIQQASPTINASIRQSPTQKHEPFVLDDFEMS